MKKFKIIRVIMSAIVLCIFSNGYVLAGENILEDTEILIINEEVNTSQVALKQTPEFKVNFEIKMDLTQKEISELQSAYNDLVKYANSNNIPLNLEYSTFFEAFKERPYDSVEDYVAVYYSLLQPMEYSENRSSGSSKYYYDIGSSLPSAVTPNYSKYNLLSTVQKGDLIYEANGGFGITGHIAIVEGFYYNAARDITYIRIIEAIDVGVCRSLLDDTRVDDKEAFLLRVHGSNITTENNAVSFCVGELGSSYFLDFKKDTSSSETDWYCSELVWAGYYNQGIDIEREPFLSEPGVTPRDIYNSNKVYSISFK